MVIDPLDQTHLTPLAPCAIEAILGDRQGDMPAYRLEFDPELDHLRVFDGDMLVLETVETVLGGTLVRIAPMMGDAFEMARFIDDRQGVDTLIECELKAGTIETITTDLLHGMPAARIKGKWRPIDEEDRARWAVHAADANTARMRAAGAMRKAA